jgi:transcriptional regulator with XRE-family HTH domain
MTEHLPPGIGERLRSLRVHGQLSLREVEQRSLHFVQERGDLSFQVSASWLDRLEREKHELTVNKVIVLADMYNLPLIKLFAPYTREMPKPCQSGNVPVRTRPCC